MQSGGAIPPPPKGHLSDNRPIPYENKANGVRYPPSAVLSRKGIARYGGGSRIGPLRGQEGFAIDFDPFPRPVPFLPPFLSFCLDREGVLGGGADSDSFWLRIPSIYCVGFCWYGFLWEFEDLP